ncbi:hypothetical protein PGH24_07620 [Thermoanaerobacterium thermosaccharolyticum]|uniref:DUF6731 family protein n=1 Tax=Thermoanaerobacterium thermosaccharolyticum TaxID=1517 RepID=UPI00279D2921|nr:hypothetical protein PGH24_07620 [Thermoanaerobacterium thermosaccharolyticum]
MSRTIKFYNVAIFKNGQKTNINFLNFIDKLSFITWENRVRKIEDDITALFPLYFIDNLPEVRIIPIGKFRRNYKPFIGSITTSKLSSIKNDVIELVTMVYSQKYMTAILEFNNYGSKQKNIEEYFNSFLPRTNDKWEVKLIPIISNKSKDDIYKSEQVRYIEIKLKLDEYTADIINNNIKFDKENSVLNLFDNVEDASSLEAKIMRIEFGVGRSHKATMNLETVKMLLEMLNINHDCIESVKVRYRDRRTKKTDTIDLKNMNQQLQEKILENENTNPAPEYIGNIMGEFFNSYEATLIESYENFYSGMISSDFPIIQEVPREENLIEPE